MDLLPICSWFQPLKYLMIMSDPQSNSLFCAKEIFACFNPTINTYIWVFSCCFCLFVCLKKLNNHFTFIFSTQLIFFSFISSYIHLYPLQLHNPHLFNLNFQTSRSYQVIDSLPVIFSYHFYYVVSWEPVALL